MESQIKTFYAGSELTVRIPKANLVNEVIPHKAPSLEDPEGYLRNLLENPIGCDKLVDMVKPGDKIALITSEYLRMPYTWILAPIVVDLLKKEVGVKDKNIVLVNAPGTHETEDQQVESPLVRKVFGSLYGRHRFVMHDCDKRETHEFIGYTSQATPVWINKAVSEADVKIGFGELAPHHSAGHCGGGKIILPGVSARATLGSMHRRVMNQKNEKHHPEWQMGAYGNDERNEVRRDIEDAASLAGLDFKIDTVTGRPGRELYGIYAGDFVKEHREGVKLCKKIYGTKISEKTDICVYLSGKRGNYLNHTFWYAPSLSDQATKDDGIAIQVISGESGWQNPTYHETFLPSLMRMSTEEMAWRIAGDIEKGCNLRDVSCAWQVKRAIELKKTFMVTEHPNKELLHELGVQYVTNSFDEALSRALEEKGKDATITVIHQGGYILPPN